MLFFLWILIFILIVKNDFVYYCYLYCWFNFFIFEIYFCNSFFIKKIIFFFLYVDDFINCLKSLLFVVFVCISNYMYY